MKQYKNYPKCFKKLLNSMVSNRANIEYGEKDYLNISYLKISFGFLPNDNNPNDNEKKMMETAEFLRKYLIYYINKPDYIKKNDLLIDTSSAAYMHARIYFFVDSQWNEALKMYLPKELKKINKLVGGYLQRLDKSAAQENISLNDNSTSLFSSSQHNTTINDDDGISMLPMPEPFISRS